MIGRAVPCCFFVNPEGAPGWRNMALDRGLLDLATDDGATYLRLYRWEPHCLSFGRNEPATRRYDQAQIQRLTLPVVRRPTGGRAVWHGHELTYALAAPTAGFGNLKEAYHEIHAMLAQALTQLGVAASLAPSPIGPVGLDAGPCFASPAGGEIMLPGGKVVGSAQLRLGQVFLQHGSLLLEGSQEPVRALLRGPGDVQAAGDTSLSNTLGRRVPFGEVADAIRSCLADWRGPWLPADGAVTDRLEVAAARHAPLFRSDAWTWHR